MKEQIEAVKRMQDYINNHLFEKITLNDLSKVSLFSPYIFTIYKKDSRRLY